MEAYGERKDDWIGSLIETSAKYTYRGFDYQVTIRMETLPARHARRLRAADDA